MKRKMNRHTMISTCNKPTNVTVCCEAKKKALTFSKPYKAGYKLFWTLMWQHWLLTNTLANVGCFAAFFHVFVARVYGSYKNVCVRFDDNVRTQFHAKQQTSRWFVFLYTVPTLLRVCVFNVYISMSVLFVYLWVCFMHTYNWRM